MDTVITEKINKVGIIKLNRPQSLNCINEKMAMDFEKAIQDLQEDEYINIIIVTGEGKAFCAGGDINAIKNLKSADETVAFVRKAGTITSNIYHCPKPVIAMVNGAAAGAGFNIALACDLIFAAQNSKFIQSFANVGLAPDCGGHYFLPRAIGIHLAKQYMFEASPITAQQGLDYGFVNKIFPPEELASATFAYAEKLSNQAPLALQKCKHLLNTSDNYTLDDILHAEAKNQGDLVMSQDCQEGLSAFLEKRQPNFKGK